MQPQRWRSDFAPWKKSVVLDTFDKWLYYRRVFVCMYVYVDRCLVSAVTYYVYVCRQKRIVICFH